MKKICSCIAIIMCSQVYGQIHLDSATYYTLITHGIWVERGVDDWKDSLSIDLCGGTRLIDRSSYQIHDCHCMPVPLSYSLQIKDTVFVLYIEDVQINDVYSKRKLNMYVYGWFVDRSILKIVESRKRIKLRNLTKEECDIYNRHTYR